MMNKNNLIYHYNQFKIFGCHLLILSLKIPRLPTPLICIGKVFQMQFPSYVRDLSPYVVVLAFGITVVLGSPRLYGVTSTVH